jgi:2-methylcitrate dehydratase
MPYTAAVALMYGAVDAHHFDDEFLSNPELLDLVGRVKVSVSEEANRRAPGAMLCNLEVVTKSGDRYQAEVAYHKGHYKNPLSDGEVEAKFRSLAAGVIPENRTDALLASLWRLEEVAHIGEVIGLARR